MNVLRARSLLDRTVNPRINEIATGLEKRWPWLLAFCAFGFLGLTLLLDSKRPLWNDELFTYYISQQATLGDVWKTLLTGAEQLPPFFFVLTRASTSIFGAGKVAFRLPETLGFLLMSAAAFFFVHKRSSASYGLVAFLFPSLTYAFYFAYEARPYGIVMGFCGGAILCWQLAVERRRRVLSLLGLTLCLASALACHYYAVLILSPFLLAEFARYIHTRRLDVHLYSAICIGFAPVLIFLPLLRASSHYSSKFWAKPQWTALISFYENLLDTSAFALLLVVLLAGVAVRQYSGGRMEVEQRRGAPFYEVVLALGFALLPVLAILLAEFVTGAFTSRYAIYSVLGITILFALSLSSIGARAPHLGLAAAAALLACWSVIFVRQYKAFSANAAEEGKTFQLLQKLSLDDPLVIAGPHVFFAMSHQANVHRTGHFIFLADVSRAVRYTGTDTVERGLLALKQIAPLDVEDYRQFTNSHTRFLVYDPGAPFSWVLTDLIKSGRPVSIYAAGPQEHLYAVGPLARPANAIADGDSGEQPNRRAQHPR